MTVWEEKLTTRKTTHKSMKKTNTGGGSQSTTVEVDRNLENYKLYCWTPYLNTLLCDPECEL